MKKVIQIIFISTIGLLIGCQKNKLTGRRTLKLVNDTELANYSAEQYKAILKESTIISDTTPAGSLVNRVGNNIKTAVENYYNKTGQAEKLKNYQWEFHLIKNDTLVNAWCMPGGKVVVYSGLLNYAQSEEELAVVLGHEIGHAVCNHGNERMSEQILVQIGEKTLQIALIATPKLVKNILLQSFGVPMELGLLAFSRQDEKEADKIGLTLMAMAGYQPKIATNFWLKMINLHTKQPFVLLSTHPGNKKRLKLIKKEIPKAEKYIYIKTST